MKKFVAIVAALSIASFASAQIPYFSDFEADGGGFVPAGDWERGTPVGADGSDLGGFGGPEPVGGFSGDFVWGTVIGGLHNPSTVSTLSQTFDFSSASGASMSFYEWIDSGGNAFDTAEVMVNGSQLYLSDGGPSQWRPVGLDLSAYDGLAAVTVDFVFTTTTVVERVGWYIDDVSIVPEPASLALVALGALVLIRRR